MKVYVVSSSYGLEGVYSTRTKADSGIKFLRNLAAYKSKDCVVLVTELDVDPEGE